MNTHQAEAAHAGVQGGDKFLPISIELRVIFTAIAAMGVKKVMERESERTETHSGTHSQPSQLWESKK